MSDWLDYQELTASIYRDLSPGAVVTHDDKILGLNSGTQRQIDVSIRSSIASHDILVIVQAKDLKRRADVKVVDEFKAVIADVRAAKGVLICSGGFTNNARKYAKRENIDLCTAHDARSRKWSLDLQIPILWIEPTIEFMIELELHPKAIATAPAELAVDAAHWLISRDQGATCETFSEILCKRWGEPSTPRSSGERHRLEIACDDMELRLSENYWCPVARLAFNYTIHRQGWRGTFTFSQCRGIRNVVTGELRAKVGLTNLDIPIERHPSWHPIEDIAVFEASSPDLMRIEKAEPTPVSLMIDPEGFHKHGFTQSVA